MIRIRNYALPVPEASGLPPCLLQVTRLPSQTMLWVGSIMGNAKLASDWSAAMPGFGVRPPSRVLPVISLQNTGSPNAERYISEQDYQQ